MASMIQCAARQRVLKCSLFEDESHSVTRDI